MLFCQEITHISYSLTLYPKCSETGLPILWFLMNLISLLCQESLKSNKMVLHIKLLKIWGIFLAYVLMVLSILNKLSIHGSENLDTTHGYCPRASIWSFSESDCHGGYQRLICHLNLEDFCAMILDPNFGQCLMANKLNLYVDPTPVLLIARKYSPMLPFLNISESLNMLDWCRSKVSKDLKPFPCNIGLYCNNYNETKTDWKVQWFDKMLSLKILNLKRKYLDCMYK